MASASYTFTHLNGFQTRIDLQDGATGVVNWQAYFIRTNFAWTSYNLFGPTSGPFFSFALGGVGFSGYYTYDFRGSATQYTMGSGSISVPSGSALSLSGTNDPKGSMGATTASGTFTTASPPPPPTPTWSTGTSLAGATVGIAYSATVTASPVTSYSLVSSSGATGGLSFSGNTISGTPTTPGTATFTIRANNSGSTADRTFTIVILGSGGKVWNGTAFVAGVASVWNGTAFVSGILKVWDGTTWVNTN